MEFKFLFLLVCTTSELYVIMNDELDELHGKNIQQIFMIATKMHFYFSPHFQAFFLFSVSSEK